MHAPIRRADDQRRLAPRSLAHVVWQIMPGHHDKQSDERSVSFFEYHGPATDDGELGISSGLLNALKLLFRKDTGEHAARGEMSRRNARVVRDIAAQLEPARHFLRMVSMEARVGRKVRRAAEDEVEVLLRSQRRVFRPVLITKIAVAYFVPQLEPVVRRRFAR